MMAYHRGFVVSLLLHGKPVRETRGDGDVRVCRIPFNSEYALRLKNNTADTALVTVSIDSTPVVVGGEIVLEAGDALDLERFIDASSPLYGRKFKFVTLDNPDVQDPTNSENGLIEVKFQPVQRPRRIVTTRFNAAHERLGPLSAYGVGESVTKGPQARSQNICDHAGATVQAEPIACCASPMRSFSDKGATVEGDLSAQKFDTTFSHFEWCAPAVVIPLRLCGLVGHYGGYSGRFPWSVRDGKLYRGDCEMTGYGHASANSDGSITIFP